MRIFPLLLALGLAVTGAVAPLAPAAAVDGVSLTIAPAGNGVIGPEADLVVNGTVLNEGTAPTEAAAVTLHVARTAVTDRAELLEWLTAEEPPELEVGAAVATAGVPAIGAAQSRGFSLSVAADDLGLPGFGSYPIQVRYSPPGSEPTVEEGAIVWNPGSTPSFSLSAAAALTVPPPASGLLDATQLEDYTAPTGALSRMLDEYVTSGVAIGVDPMIIASIRLLGTTAPPSATAWLARLAAVPNETFALSYADSDLGLLSQAGAGVLTPVAFRMDPAAVPVPEDATATPAPVDPAAPPVDEVLAWPYTIDGIAWPRPDTVTTADLATFTAAGYTTTLLSSSGIDRDRFTSPVTIDGTTGIVSDDIVANLISQAVASPSLSAWQATMAQLAASTAELARTHPGSPVFAALNRGADAPRFAETFEALQSFPWVSRAAMTENMAADAGAATISQELAADPRVATVNSLLQTEAAVANFATVLADPTQLTGPRRLALLATVSNQWALDVTGGAALVEQFRTDGFDILNAISIPSGSTVNLLSDNGPLPITVSNALAYPATVHVSVKPARAILNVTEDPIVLTIEANSQAKAFVPVQTVANGQVRTVVTLSSPAAVPISQPVTVSLNVQAGWETAATWVLAAIVVVMFIAGVIRTIRKRRRAVQEPAQEAA
jgi:hypothetical protein